MTTKARVLARVPALFFGQDADECSRGEEIVEDWVVVQSSRDDVVPAAVI
jgi:hypothetical protein